MPRSNRLLHRGAGERSDVAPEEQKRGVLDRRFWLFVVGIVLVLVLTRTFDFTLVPPEYKGIHIIQPFCGLHSWHEADRSWMGRCHVKYGLSYTKGYPTLVVGDPPPMLPEYHVGHPPMDSRISALGVLLFGMQDWSARVFDVVISVPCLLVIVALLRRLYGSECALLSGLLLVLLPLSAYFGFEPLMAMFSLWALYRYLQLIGRLSGGAEVRSRLLVELAVALFLLVQLNWVGIFYALAIGLHYVLTCMVRQHIQWKVLAVLAVASLSSLGLNVHVMLSGLRHNQAVEAPYRRPGLTASAGNVSSWELVKSLYQWRASEGERDSFSWSAWLGKNLEHAQTNFTAPVLVFAAVYLLYLLIAHLRAFGLGIVRASKQDRKGQCIDVPRPFGHLWFFLLPGLMFLFVFKGLFWEHQYWQSPFALFMAVGATLWVLLMGDLFARIHLWLGRSVVVTLVLVLVVFCNHGLAQYRAIRWQSPRTLALFAKLNKEIPPDKALLTFKDVTVKQHKGMPAFYRPEYAWYLDRETIPANAWQYEPYYWVLPVWIDDVAAETVKEVQAQAQTGRFWYYLIPAREEYRFDPLAEELTGRQMAQILPNLESIAGDPQDAHAASWDRKSKGVASLTPEELERRLNDSDRSDDRILYWEKHRRYREAVIARLKGLYHWEYYENEAKPGDEDFCYRGDTPCYLFDLLRPK